MFWDQGSKVRSLGAVMGALGVKLVVEAVRAVRAT